MTWRRFVKLLRRWRQSGELYGGVSAGATDLGLVVVPIIVRMPAADLDGIHYVRWSE